MTTPSDGDRLAQLERTVGILWAATCYLQQCLPTVCSAPPKRRWSTAPVLIPALTVGTETGQSHITLQSSCTVSAYSNPVLTGFSGITLQSSCTVTPIDNPSVTGFSALTLESSCSVIYLAAPAVSGTSTLTLSSSSTVTYVRLGIATGSTSLTLSSASTVTVVEGYPKPSAGDYKWSAQTATHGRWLLCQGGTFSSATYPALAAVLGNTWGAHSGTTYHLPDQRGRSIIAAGTGAGLTARTVGQTGGAESVTLASAQSGVPAHLHPIYRSTSLFLASGSAIGFPGAAAGGTTNVGETTQNNIAADATNSHENMHPFTVLGNLFIWAE